MRIAYVGLTSPILYDHTGDIPSVTEGDRVGNAVLESPFGVLLLFDEIWFACRALCPHNMQSLSYVRFLHEDGVLPDLVDIIRHAQKRNAPAEFLPPSDAIEETVHAYVSRYRQARSRISKALPGRELRGKQSMILWGETVSLHRLFDSRLLPLDLEIVRLLDDEHVEFITNSATEVWLQEGRSKAFQLSLADSLVIEAIPNFVTPLGPYHECIEEVRANRYLRDFRDWISRQQGVPDPQVLGEAKRDVENAIREAEEEVFLEQFDTATCFRSIGRTALGAVIDAIVPFLGTAYALAREAERCTTLKTRRWQAFLVSAARQSRASDSDPPASRR